MTPPASAAAMAEAEQRLASDPAASAFVSAHAGAGKTTLLIDRLLRLMLAGDDPTRILCLTFTKAAAAEMAIRLQKRLGAWVTLDDPALDAELERLETAPGPETRAKARKLFAAVLDLPGGMRIGTIHAFCQSLLRRFPLEARISPHFQLIEPTDARVSLDSAREIALPHADPAALETLAGLVGADAFAALVAGLEGDRERLRPALALPPAALSAALRRAAGLTAADEATLLAQAVSWADEKPLAAQIKLAALHGSDGVRRKADAMLGWLGQPPDSRREHWEHWVAEFLQADGKPRGLSIFANKALAVLYPAIIPACEAEQQRIATILDQSRALAMARASEGLLRTAAPILALHDQAKTRAGLLDYADLIGRTAALLHGAAPWVLFKLDGGLDHLLLDEVQDTAPEQWAIADRLTGEFFAGEGAREGANRTIFAVGDRKQSIYSFQGADPDEFDRWNNTYQARAAAAERLWRPTVLDVSFRSTAPVLGLVDAVFATAEAASGVCTPGTLRHIPNRAGHAGSVELWPLAPRPEPSAAQGWQIPERNLTQSSAPETLVAELARWIARETDGSVMLPSAGRPLRPGDILVLVRRRGEFDRGLVRALKSAGVPVAGLDRMVLTEQVAVQDLLALCDALLLPQDDLTFAEMLVSPVGSLSDDSLMHLAMQRSGTLWDTLRARAHERPEWQAARTLFASLLARVDFVSPHALLVEILGAQGGAARLYARLGPQAAEPIDELLAASLHYASLHPPSLQGFTHWLRQSGAEVKREAEAAGDAVRIMTVHGAKGLEAPLVILPDTSSLPPDDRSLLWARDPDTGTELPLWIPNREFRSTATDQLRQQGQAARLGEYRRLLYVALTRARDRLLVCGWQTHRAQPGNWHALVEAGLRSLGAATADFAAWPGEALTHAAAQSAPPEPDRPRAAEAAASFPDWAGAAPGWRPRPLPPEPALPARLAPSRPEGAEHGPVPPSRSPLIAATPGRFGRGLFVHALLQHLPALAPDARPDAAHAYARASTLEDAKTLAVQALAVLADPALAPLFGPDSRAEQPIAGLVGTHIVTGQVDRLAVLPDRILIADYKTSRAPPASPDAVPILYLRQMAAYRAVLRLLYPDRDTICLLVWTEGPIAMTLPPALLDRHAPGAAPIA